MNTPVYIEVLTPRHDTEDLDRDLQRFAGKYRKVLDGGFVVSIPDNPLGRPRFQMAEVVSELGLPLPASRILLHLNTFHTRPDLDAILAGAADMGIRNLLAVSGDGGPRLHKLEPEDLGADTNTITSVELLEHINGRYPGIFHCGVAFNPYEPQRHELEKMKRKIDAGARFIITQPVMGPDERINALRPFGIPVAVGAWMSKRLELLSECVGQQLEDRPYDPMVNLRNLSRDYPDFGVYLSMLGFLSQLPQLNGILLIPDCAVASPA